MLKWLILLALLVDNSLGLGLYKDINDYHLRRRGGPSVHTTASNDAACKKDVLIVWDNSQPTGAANFNEKLTPFLSNFVNSDRLKVGEHGTHLGFISYSTKERTKTILEIGSKTTVKELTDWLNGLNYKCDLMGKWAYGGSGLKIANETFQQKSPLNHRPRVEDAFFLIAHGPTNASTRALRKEQRRLERECMRSLEDDKDVTMTYLAVFENPTVLSNIKALPSNVFATDLNHLDDVLDKVVMKICQPPGCICDQRTTFVNTYVKPDEVDTIVLWKPPKLEQLKPLKTVSCTMIKEPSVKPGTRFGLGKHGLEYIFWNGKNNNENMTTSCFMNINVQRCSCPNTTTIETVEQGKTTVEVNWKEPEPNCPTIGDSLNPGTNGSFPVGEHYRTYSYMYLEPERHAFQLECRVDILIKGYCGPDVYDPAKQHCCYGIIREKKSGHKCCGSRYYDPSTHECCDEKTAVFLTRGNCP